MLAITMSSLQLRGSRHGERLRCPRVVFSRTWLAGACVGERQLLSESAVAMAAEMRRDLSRRTGQLPSRDLCAAMVNNIAKGRQPFAPVTRRKIEHFEGARGDRRGDDPACSDRDGGPPVTDNYIYFQKMNTKKHSLRQTVDPVLKGRGHLNDALQIAMQSPELMTVPEEAIE